MAKVSYSQYSTWKSCPFKWKLSFVDKLRLNLDNIYSLFGSAIHYVLQEYLKTAYHSTASTADKLELDVMLINKMKELYEESTKKKGFVKFTTKEEISEFFEDGIEILEFFKKKRADYFMMRNYSLLGIEVPLKINIKSEVEFVGFIDVIIRDDSNGDIYIYDFKTSTYGWNDYMKKDETKYSQLLLYKHYYSKQYEVPQEKINIEFLILKRKLYDNVPYPQKHIQRFTPANGLRSVNKSVTAFESFVNECYNDDGTFVEKEHKKTPSKKICGWCEFYNTEYCDSKV